MSNNRNRKSILRKITDSLSFIVPNHILDKSSSNKHAQEENIHVSANNNADATFNPKKIYSKYDVDLDNEFDSDNSEISLSTSGVSSLNPKTNDILNVKSELKGIGKRNIPTDGVIEQSSSKRFRVQVPSGSASGAIPSDSFLLQNDPNQSRICYGSQYPSITRTFQSSSTVKYDVEDKRSNHTQTAASIVLGSTARKMLERLEKFRTPIHVSSKIPARSNEYKSTYANDVWKASRYPPYMNAFKRYKMMISKTREKNEKPSSDETKTIPIVPQEFKPIVHNKVQENPESKDTIKSLEAQTTREIIENASSTNNQDYIFSNPIFLSANKSVYSGNPNSFKFANPLVLISNEDNLDVQTKTDMHNNSNSLLLSSLFSLKRDIDVKKEIETVSKKTIKFNSEAVWRCTNCFMEMPETKTACSKCWLPRNINEENDDESDDKDQSDEVSSEEENVDLDLSNSKIASPKEEIKTSDSNLPVLAKKWECETCMVLNEDNQNKCVCCSANRPSKNFNEPESKKTPTFGQPPIKSQNWDCPTCMVPNKQESIKCVCCSTMNPNNKENSQSQDVKSTAFIFGKPSEDKPVTDATKPSTFFFNFGSNAESNDKKSCPFNFGTNKIGNADNKTENSTPFFTFGTKSTSEAQGKTEPAKDTGIKFSFGSTNNKEDTSNSTPNPCPFNFGASNSIPFSFGSSTNKSTTFSFGSSATSDKPVDSTAQTSAGGFQFSTPQSQSGSAFNFGSSVPANPFSAGSTSTLSNQNTFTFGSQSSNPIQSSASVNPFNANTGAPTEQRIYRRLTRRIRK